MSPPAANVRATDLFAGDAFPPFPETAQHQTHAGGHRLSGIDYPGPNDVMFGRGGATNQHIGNIQFRQLVAEHKLDYIAAAKGKKSQISMRVVDAWRGQGGRFLQKTNPELGDDSFWHDVGEKEAKKKATQCLRERTPDIDNVLENLSQEQVIEEERQSMKKIDDSDNDDLHESSDSLSIIPADSRELMEAPTIGNMSESKRRIFPDISFDNALTSVDTSVEENEKVLFATKGFKSDDPCSDGCQADTAQPKDEQDVSMETSQREEHSPVPTSKNSEPKDKDTTAISTDISKQLDPPLWTTEDDNALLLARLRHPHLTWAEVAALLPGNRSLSACYSRYHKLLQKKGVAPPKQPSRRPQKTPRRDSESQFVGRPRGWPQKNPRRDSGTQIIGQSFSNASWTTKENDTLKRNKARGLSWEDVASFLPERSSRDCKQQYEKLCMTMKDASTPQPLSDVSPSPKSNTGSELVLKQRDVLCESDKDKTTVSTSPELLTNDMALTNNGCRENGKRKRKDTSRWTEDDRRLVQNSYLLSLPRW